MNQKKKKTTKTEQRSDKQTTKERGGGGGKCTVHSLSTAVRNTVSLTFSDL